MDRNQIVALLKDIDRIKGQVNDIQVPLEVFEYVLFLSHFLLYKV